MVAEYFAQVHKRITILGKVDESHGRGLIKMYVQLSTMDLLPSNKYRNHTPPNPHPFPLHIPHSHKDMVLTP